MSSTFTAQLPHLTGTRFANIHHDDDAIIQAINHLLQDAIAQQISDIHFEPYETFYRVRFRRDGLLIEIGRPPLDVSARLTVRLKVMAELDIAERRLPQDGRFKFTNDSKTDIDIRVSTCPTLFGEKIVLRLLDPAQLNLEWDQLGYDPKQKQLFLDAIARPQGMVLVTGPTGSGKTVSLYTALRQLNTTDKNLLTVEDPVEIYLPGVNQVMVNRKAGLHFPQALRAFLRQDPDIMMVGEIRDLETADIAIKAAQTGHLVLSTLHTNSAADTLVRLFNMGVAPFNLAASVSLIISQRLARCLCSHCKIPHTLPDTILEEMDILYKTDKLGMTSNTFQANTDGCQHCHQGYSGRIGIFEVMPITTAVREKILTGTATEIAQQAEKEGMLTLQATGFKKVLAGMTSLSELSRTIDLRDNALKK